MNQEPKRMDRRKFIYAGLGAVIIILGGVAAYFATRPPEVIEKVVEKPVEKIVTTTVEKPVEKTVVKTVAGTPTTIVKTEKVVETLVKTVTPTPPTKKYKFTLAFPGEPDPKIGHYKQLLGAFKIFQSRHPDIIEPEPEIIAKPWGEYFTYLTAAFGAGDPPTILLDDCIWVPKHQALEFLEPLDDYIAKWGEYDNWLPTFKEGMTWDGKTYGIWGNTDARPFWYWKKYFPEGFPQTYDEMIKKARKLVDEGKPPMCSWAGAAIYPWYIIYLNILPEKMIGPPGWGLFEVENGKWTPIFNNEWGLDALKMTKEMKEAGFYMAPIPEFGPSTDAFFEGKYSAALIGTWLTGTAKGKGWTYDKILEDFGVAFLPPPPGGRIHAGIPGGWSFVIPKATKVPKELIWEFITIALDKEYMAKTYAELGYLPTRKDAWPLYIEYSKNLKTDPFAGEWVKAFKNVYIRPEIVEWDRVQKALDDMQWAVITGKATPKEAAKAAEEKIKIIMG
jgi:multiple sugar transport system substrate-binding protein